MRRCAARLAVTALAAACGGGGSGAGGGDRSPVRPNVLLVTIDTFRGDRLGAGVAPALDRLALTAVRFTNARTAVPLTLPSHTTMLTGLLPSVHGVRQNGVEAAGDTHPTIARLLHDAGYQTAAFVGAFVLDRRYGLARGFDTYDDQIPRDPRATERLEAERPASAVVDRALAWLEAAYPPPGAGRPAAGAPRAAPFFVWIHLYDPHAPYDPPAQFRARTKTPYDGEIAYADAQIARVFEWLRSRQLAGHTVIVVAGDHGEGLGDHGERTHGMLLYDSTLRVPLVVAAPGRAAAQRDDAVSLAEIAPTILRAAGVTPPLEMKGRDLLDDRAATSGSTAASGSVRLQPDLYAETEYPRVAGWSPLEALTDGRWMAIRSGAAIELYDLWSDPQEQHDVASTQASRAAAMASRIDAIRAGATSSAARDVSPEAAERLRALGYVASAPPEAPVSAAPNPAVRIETWNRFEAALSALDDRSPAALPALAKLASENPDAPVFQTTYARALKEAGRITPALSAYRGAARRWPADATLLHDLAVAAREAGDLREARRADEAAIRLAPASAPAHNGAGLVAIDQHRLQDAAREFERAAALDPNNASYWTNLGNAKRAIGDAAGAEQAYRRALDADARSSDAANGLGVLLVEAHRPADAVTWLERALAAAPAFVEARLNLGIALQQSGDRRRAAEEYRRVLAAPARYTRERDAAARLLAALGSAR